jgi:hypothetical protein
VHDFAGLVHKLHLFLGVAVVHEGIHLREQVERDALRQRIYFQRLVAVQHLPGLLFKLRHGLGAGAAGRLVGGHHHAADRVDLVERIGRHQKDRGAAVGVGDHAFMRKDVRRIDLRHHQRHIRIHAERRGVVNDDRAGLDRRRRKFLGARRARAEQGDVHALEGVLRQQFNGDGLAAEHHLFPDRPLRGQQFQRAYGEIALLQRFHHFHAHGSGGPDNRDIVCFAHVSNPPFFFRGNKLHQTLRPLQAGLQFI